MFLFARYLHLLVKIFIKVKNGLMMNPAVEKRSICVWLLYFAKSDSKCASFVEANNSTVKSKDSLYQSYIGELKAKTTSTTARTSSENVTSCFAVLMFF